MIAMKKMLSMLVSACLMFVCVNAFAANAAMTVNPVMNHVKVGLVDMGLLLQKAPQVAVINKQLNAQFGPQQQKIITMQNNIRTEYNKLNAGSPQLTLAEQTRLKDQIAQQQKELQNMVVSFQQTANAAQTKAYSGLMTQINNAVKNIAQREKLDIVLAKPAVLYSADTIDMTPEVLKQLQ
jgi:outer membrane protein